MPRSLQPCFPIEIINRTRQFARRELRSIVALLLVLVLLGLYPKGVQAAAGDLDPNFGVGGKKTTDFFGNDDVGAAVAIQPDGKIVVAAGAYLSADLADFGVARYNTDGSLDSSFGSGGKTTTDFFGDIDLAFGVAIQPSDGKIIAVGFAAKPTGDHYETFFALARYNTNGTIDTTFGSGGKVTTDVLGINISQALNVIFVQSAMGILVQPDDKIVVAGGVIAVLAAMGVSPAPLSNFGLARYNANGTLDTNFGGSGKISRDFFGQNDTAFGVALQPDNKIVAAGYATKNSGAFDQDFAWLRYNSDGSPDNTFGSGGRITTDFVGDQDLADALTIQLDGKIVLGGFTNNVNNGDLALVRYNVDGSLDSSFGSGGKFTNDVFGSYDEIYGLALQSDGKIVASGVATTNTGNENFLVARFNTNGTFDQSFGSGGKVTTDFFGGEDFATGVKIQADGKIVVTGAANTGSFADLAVARYLAPPAGPPPTIQFGPSFAVDEIGPQGVAVVTRSGDTSGPSTVSYATSDTAGANNCNFNNGIASSRCDYLTTIGTLQFAANETSKNIFIPVVDDAYAEGTETFTVTLSNPTGATLGSPITTNVTITDNDASTGPNPIDQAGFFVRLHYVDFLNREPDSAGLSFWTNQITSCGSDQACIEIKRINVSAAFFLSIEFQETGYLAYRMYKASYGNIAGTPVPVRFIEFLPDTQQIGKGVVVGVGNWQAQLEANKVAFSQDFVTRSRFTTAYPTTLTPAQFVDALFANAGVTPSTFDRNVAINEFAGAGNTADTAARGRALRRVAENSLLNQQETNRAFVLMQYFGYLRRNPNDAPEQNLNFDGYNFWLGKLNQFNGNFVNAEMVKAFLVAGEYRHRFGP